MEDETDSSRADGVLEHALLMTDEVSQSPAAKDGFATLRGN